jgi:trans-aconitate methyltransferase
MNKVCKICGNFIGNTSYVAREMMIGMREEFRYFQCANCDCLQIEEVPVNMDKFYPSNYYSFNQKLLKKNTKFKKWIAFKRANYALFKKGFFGMFLNMLHPNPIFELISKTNINKDSKVLDIGCGSGNILYSMMHSGMRNLKGIDPYINENILYENGLLIEKKELQDEIGNWDLIMMHHVLEHMDNQIDVLKSIFLKLSDKGTCMIRIPTVTSQAWQKYKTNWVSLDAPRHFFLHSMKSFMILVEGQGFYIDKVIYDSTSFQFWASEQYILNIPLMDARSFSENPKNAFIKSKEVKDFERLAIKLNEENNGDQFVAFIKKKI